MGIVKNKEMKYNKEYERWMKMKYKHMKEDWVIIRPWFFLVTYIILFTAFIFRFDVVSATVFSFVGMFESLLYGIGFAFVINVFMIKIESLLKRVIKEQSFCYRFLRGFAIALSLFLVFGVLILVFSIIMPRIIESLMQLLSNMSVLLRNIIDNIDEVLAYFHIDYQLTDIATIQQFLNMDWSEIFKNAMSVLGSSANGLISNAVSFTSTFAIVFTGFMFSLYLLASKEAYIRQLRKVCVVALGVENASHVFTWGSRANRIFSSFITGQLTEACILWILYYLTMKLFHFPYPELISTLIAVCSIIPVFGSMFAMSVGAILILSIDPLTSLLFIIFYQVMQQLEDNLIYPRVVGNSVGLPGLWVLLSIFIFGAQFGILGMLLAVPTTAFVYTMFADFINTRLKKQKIIVTDTTITSSKEDTDEKKTA